MKLKRTLDHDTGTGLARALVAASPSVRYAALVTIGNRDQAAMTLHAGAIVGMLADANARVRLAAAEILGKLVQSALAVHTGAIVGVLADANCDVRHAA